MIKARSGANPESLDKKERQFERRWRQLQHALRTAHENHEAARLANEREAIANRLRPLADALSAECYRSPDKPSERARELKATHDAALADAVRGWPIANVVPSYRIADDLALSDKGREAFREARSLYAELSAAGVHLLAMQEFALWLGHRIARDFDAHGALVDLHSAGGQRTQPTPLRDIEITAAVALERDIRYASGGGRLAWFERVFEIAPVQALVFAPVLETVP